MGSHPWKRNYDTNPNKNVKHDPKKPTPKPEKRGAGKGACLSCGRFGGSNPCAECRKSHAHPS